jgi:DNA polymerase
MKKISEALEFYRENDIDEVIVEEPVNHYLAKEKVAQNLKIENKNIEISKQKVEVNAVKKSFVKPVFSTSQALSVLAKKNNLNEKFMPLNEIVANAKKVAAKCTNLQELKKAIEDFEGCGLKKMATNTVFCDGNEDAKIMIIGEAPGNHEDLQGIPFCGDSGKLLDGMFDSIGLSRKDGIYITNVIFWRPPGNRRPTEEELAICRPFVERHIQLFDPKIIVLVGSTSMAAILGINDPVTKVRGKVIEYKPDFLTKAIDAFVIFHPSYLLRQSGKKRIAWRDMLELEKVLKNY